MVPDLRAWQVEALSAWLVGSRGIVSAVTGGGKTILALACMQNFLAREPAGRVLVLVPSVALQDQWFVESQSALPGQSVAAWNGKGSRADVVIMVMNSARRHASQLADDGKWMLVVDECHRLATPENAKALEGGFEATLGLSATPERQYDDNTETMLVPVLGPVLFRYTYREALQDKVIVPYQLENYRVEMSDEESFEYERLTAGIARLLHSVPRSEERLRRLLLKRARLVQNLSAREPAATALIDRRPRMRSLVFHESVAAADRITSYLAARGHRVVAYHSKLAQTSRRQALFEFRTGMKDVLVCCQALDEGLNVPRTEFAVIASSTASQRQRIQRLGRILRPYPGKDTATIATIYATSLERGALEREANDMLGLIDSKWYGVRT